MSFWRKLPGHPRESDSGRTDSDKKIAIVGNPNVGKSVMFNNLTGAYVTVSNYPGTTVGISRGKGKMGDKVVEVVDTPGMYSLLPITEEERIGRSILLNEHPNVIVHVVDAKNLERMLSFTLQLIEAGLPVILALNIIDEAERIGMKINIEKLSSKLGIPVVATVGITKRGMNTLKRRIAEFL
jgi:ferrous iron transport protein B